MRSALVLVVLAACDSGPPAVESKPVETHTRERAAVAPAPPPLPAVDAAGASAEPAHAPPPPRTLTKGWLDTPPWPKDATELELAWLVSTELVPDPRQPEMLLSPLDLVATMGGVSRDAVLAPQLGSMKPYNQPLCASKQTINAYAFEKGELAKITFYEGGAGGYFVRRKGADVLEVVSWELGDGACGSPAKPTACPRKEVAVVRMHVPAKVKVHEAMYEVDAKGTRTPFDCAAK